jgi:hypothetical protein
MTEPLNQAQQKIHNDIINLLNHPPKIKKEDKRKHETNLQFTYNKQNINLNAKISQNMLKQILTVLLNGIKNSPLEEKELLAIWEIIK